MHAFNSDFFDISVGQIYFSLSLIAAKGGYIITKMSQQDAFLIKGHMYKPDTDILHFLNNGNEQSLNTNHTSIKKHLNFDNIIGHNHGS